MTIFDIIVNNNINDINMYNNNIILISNNTNFNITINEFIEYLQINCKLNNYNDNYNDFLIKLNKCLKYKSIKIIFNKKLKKIINIYKSIIINIFINSKNMINTYNNILPSRL